MEGPVRKVLCGRPTVYGPKFWYGRSDVGDLLDLQY